jgi:hypothetical protein
MSDTPPSSSPDFTKVGFGAMGNVEVRHDASQHSHHEDKSQHSHVHYHVPPATPPWQPPETTNASGSNHGSGGSRHLTINIVFGLGGLGLLFLLLKQPQHQPAPIIVPPIHIENKINSDNHTVVPPEKPPVIAPPPVVVPPPAVTPPATVTEVLQVKLNRPSYKVDELMEITVTSQQAGFLYVLAVWADGRVDTLFPNSLRSDAKVAAGAQIHLPADLPPAADGRVLRYPMAMPALPGNPTRATESILAVLSPAPLALPQSTELASVPGFAAVGMLDDPDFRTRGPQPKFMKMQKGPTLEFGALPQAAVHYDVYR